MSRKEDRVEAILETLVMPYAHELGLRRCEKNHKPAGITLTCDPAMGTGFFWTHCSTTDSFAVSIMDIRLGELVSARYDHPEFYALNLMDDSPAFDAWREGMHAYAHATERQTTFAEEGIDRKTEARSGRPTKARPQPHSQRGEVTGLESKDKGSARVPSAGVVGYHQASGTFLCPLAKGSRVRSRAIRFMPQYLAELSDRFRLDREVIEAACFGNAGGPVSPAAELALRQLFSARPDKRCADLYYEGKVLELVSLLLQEHLGQPRETRTSCTSQDDLGINRAISYIHEHAFEPMTLETLEKTAMMGRTKLSQLFKDRTGMSPIEYLGSTRMEKAIVLLSDGERTVGSIAHAVGYENAGAFSERFKRATGMTPKEFRIMIR